MDHTAFSSEEVESLVIQYAHVGESHEGIGVDSVLHSDRDGRNRRQELRFGSVSELCSAA